MTISQPITHSHTSTVETGSGWRGLYRAGGAAALIAGLVLRRNLGAELSLFGLAQPETVEGWFALLRDNRLAGLAHLGFCDVLDYTLLAVMFLALCAALRPKAPGLMIAAPAFALAGMAVISAANPAFAMAALSDRYAAVDAAQHGPLLAAGQAVLALNPGGTGFPGTGYYMSFLFMALAGLLASVAMLRHGVRGGERANGFSRATAITGLLAAAIDLTYCVTFALLPGLTVFLMSAAGLLLMVWHIQVGLGLWRLGR